MVTNVPEFKLNPAYTPTADQPKAIAGLAEGLGCPTAPFIERDGEWWGRPIDDQHAIAELERMRRQEADLIVIIWPAFWWLDHYTGFAAHLRRHRQVAATEDVVIFDLRQIS